MSASLKDHIFGVRDESSFAEMALEIFRLQSAANPVYAGFIAALGIDPASVRDPGDIPFLPVAFFRSMNVITGSDPVVTIFESSTTTGATPARHLVTDTGLYERSFFSAFRLFYGDPSDYVIAALLPSYTERGNSSLVYMTDRLARASGDSNSGFYRDDREKMIRVLRDACRRGRKAILLGVSFALLDLAEDLSPDLSGVIVIETGGMKGRRKEITREELHSILTAGLNVSEIHSEYGMTELLSQAYSKGGGIFHAPPWMKVLLREDRDPLSMIRETGATGGINIIDLANINSCSFISTGDLGRLSSDGGFEVLGRFDNSDVRGCNLMIT